MTKTSVMFKCKPFYVRHIKRNGLDVGYIQLVKYNYGKDAIPHLEYSLDEPFRGKGIMKKELHKYLKNLKKLEYFCGDKLIAVVEKDNRQSQRILEHFNFAFVSKIDNYYSYIWSTKLNVKHIADVIREIAEAEKFNKECMKRREKAK